MITENPLGPVGARRSRWHQHREQTSGQRLQSLVVHSLDNRGGKSPV